MTTFRLKQLAVGALASAMILVLGFGSFTALTAHAEVDDTSSATYDPITANELLDSNFGAATGLGQGDLNDTIGALIRAALGFLGVIAVVIVLFGGFKWMTAGGNEEKVGEAKKLIIAGIIGLAIILSAYAIASFVIKQLVTATT